LWSAVTKDVGLAATVCGAGISATPLAPIANAALAASAMLAPLKDNIITSIEPDA
jgi:hypothetical protein